VFQIVFGQDGKGVNTMQINSTEIKKSLRIGFGIQDSFYAEAGFSRFKTINSCVGFTSSGYFSSLEWHPKTPNYKDVVGLKMGYEIATMIGSFGFETKYQTNFENNDFTVTPKIGIGLLGDIFVFYGYTISTNGNPFPSVGKHQLSIIFNLNKKFLK
jgi:hypothetical protein